MDTTNYIRDKVPILILQVVAFPLLGRYVEELSQGWAGMLLLVSPHSIVSYLKDEVHFGLFQAVPTSELSPKHHNKM